MDALKLFSANDSFIRSHHLKDSWQPSPSIATKMDDKLAWYTLDILL